MTPPIPFAGLAPDLRTVRAGGDLASFDLQAAIRIGRELRRTCADAISTGEVASALVDAINAFEHHGRPACVLVRAFVTRKLSDLAPELRADLALASTETDGEASCLRLVATRGIEPSWNDVEQSSGERAMLLGSGASPLIAEISRQLHLEEIQPPPSSALYIHDAGTSPGGPPVAGYGVRSIVGFGTTAWRGESLVLVVYSRVLVPRGVERALETLALYAKLAWIDAREARVAIGEARHERVRSVTLDEIVDAHELHMREDAASSQRRLDEARDEAKRLAEIEATQFEAHNENLRRTQRAMLNVIEDLREARAALESKVEVRTRELAVSNTQLESRNRELEEFVYIASHDLQEPLRTVAGYLQMIERRYATKLGAEGDEFIRFAIEGAQRMQALIESLLLYSRVATKDKTFEPLALDEALDAALRNLALSIHDSGAVVDRTSLPSVRADRIQMVQLFQNLVSNAIKFAGERPPRIHVSGEVVAGQCALTVRDEGVGFNPKYVDRIFKIFRRLRRDTPGTGIGLAVCKKIIERHGGHIEAQSTPGEGSTFVVRFPVDPPLPGDS